MVELVHLAGGQADLVAIGGVPRSRLGDDGPLGELAGHGLLNGGEGVGCTGQAHGGVDIGPAGEGVPDGAAHAGGCAAEGLNLRGVVVGFVLKEKEPVLLAVVGVHLDLHRAGVDLLGLVQVGHLPLLFQVLGHNGADVHEVHRLGAAQALAGVQIVLIGLLEDGTLELHGVNGGQEGGVAAVVRPIGVDHPQLGDGGVPVLGAEVIPAETQVIQVHGQAVVGHHGGQAVLVQLPEAVEGGHRLGDSVVHGQGVERLQRGLPRLHGVDEVLLDGSHLFRRQLPGEVVDPGGADQGALPLGEDLDALGGRIRPLIKLAGEVLHGKEDAPLREGIRHQVQLGLRQDGPDAVVKELRRDVLHIVAVEQPQPL